MPTPPKDATTATAQANRDAVARYDMADRRADVPGRECWSD